MVEEPAYLTKYRDKVDRNISEVLREQIRLIDAAPMPCRERHEAFQHVLQSYRTEKAEWIKTNNCPELQLLSILFWEVTKRTKIAKTAAKRGQEVPFWGLNEFNYPIILGRGDPEVVAISWKLTDTYGVPVATVVEIYKLVKEAARARTDLTSKAIYEEVLSLLKDLDTTGKEGLNHVWAPGIQNQIRRHFAVAKPQRKSKVVTVKEERPAPEPASPSPQRSTREEERQLQKTARDAVGKLLAIRLAEVADEWRPLIEKSTASMLSEVFHYLNNSCNRHVAHQRDQDAIVAATKTLRERREYEAACDFFGATPPPGGIVDYGPIKTLFRRLSLDFHPDHNAAPGAPAQFDAIQKHNAVIIDYHAKYREEEGRHEPPVKQVQGRQRARSRSDRLVDVEAGSSEEERQEVAGPTDPGGGGGVAVAE